MDMTTGNLIYPIGSQSFEKIRESGRIYVDKTEYIYRLLNAGDYIFLSRPRRFGKSLLISTLEAFFRAKRHLFKGLAIDRLIPEEWTAHPVIHFDLSGNNYTSVDTVNNAISTILDRYEKETGISEINRELSIRFGNIIRKMHEQTGQKVVILIDEYDNPITSAVDEPELQNKIRNILYGFYSTIKSSDPHIRFCMLTGVTKYGKLSVFSGLNNLRDISFLNTYAGICGVTEDELRTVLRPGIEEFANSKGISFEDACGLLKFNYDGYHFSEAMLDIYNPFSLMSALASNEIYEYWYETGTPTMLIKLLKSSDMDIRHLSGMKASRMTLSNISQDKLTPASLFYQTGYLTLKDYDAEDELFTLGFPNREVERGFLRSLLPYYTHNEDCEFFITRLRKELSDGNPEAFIHSLSAFLADIPYDLRKNVSRYENYYHTIFYTIFRLIGLNITCEYHTSQGSIDILLKTRNFTYVIELKIDGDADDALAQILDKGYADAFIDDRHGTFAIGLGFSKSTHNICDSRIMRLER